MEASALEDGDRAGLNNALFEGAEDEQARVDFLLSKVRETLLLREAAGEARLFEGGDENDDTGATDEVTRGRTDLQEFFPSRSKVNEADERRKRWAQEWERGQDRGSNSTGGNGGGGGGGLRSRRQDDHMSGWEGGLGDVLSPPPRERVNIDRDRVGDAASRSPPISAVPGYARPFTEADVRGKGAVADDFANQPLEAVLRRPAPRATPPSPCMPTTLSSSAGSTGRQQRQQDEDWGGGLADVLMPSNAAAGSPLYVVRQRLEHQEQPRAPARTRSMVEAERVAENDASWGNFDETFVRLRPPSGSAERRRQVHEQQRAAQRSVENARGRRTLQPYVSVYQNQDNYLTDAQIANLSYEQLQQLQDVVVAPKVKADNAMLAKRLKSVKYDEKREDLKSSECVICLESFKEGEGVKRVACGHCFHLRCIRQWFKVDVRCPTCRFDVSDVNG
mmetsp:Transcript_1070/g.2384  ORF Transcript_1070/g.2384 Transcript_1070/m.2384 type:complete len:449 (+) Transcript_1070:1918-3264(+)